MSWTDELDPHFARAWSEYVDGLAERRVLTDRARLLVAAERGALPAGAEREAFPAGVELAAILILARPAACRCAVNSAECLPVASRFAIARPKAARRKVDQSAGYQSAANRCANDPPEADRSAADQR